MKLSPSNFQTNLIFLLALVGLGLVATWITHQGLSLFGIQPAFWLETPSALAVAGVLFALFDRYLWAWQVFHKLGIVGFPDLRGRWSGEIISSHGEHTTSLPAIIEIRQTSSNIQVNLYAEHSRSTSVVATIAIDSDGMDALQYGYLNQPDASSLTTMQIHFGFAHLRHYPDIKELRGEYFTSRDRGTYGTMKFKFTGRNLRGRFE